MSGGLEDYFVRAASAADFAAFRTLRAAAGAGFTSLMVDDEALSSRLTQTSRAFAAPITAPGGERYWLALEHRPTGAVVGCAGVKSRIGDTPPFFNFRILQIAQASVSADRRFDTNVLILVNEFTQSSEVGSLFILPEHRAGGVGRMLAQSRYLLMAAEPQRFSPTVVAELRGVVGDDGRSPFWEALGRHFFRMDFEEADQLSATTDNQFILDLMPKYPIYADLLPESARAVIGECHPLGRGALKLLMWEGFRFDRVIDIFDGGPLVSCPRDTIRTFRESRRLRVAATTAMGGASAIAATAAASGFRCATGGAQRTGEHGVALSPTLAQALGATIGDEVLIWMAESAL